MLTGDSVRMITLSTGHHKVKHMWTMPTKLEYSCIRCAYLLHGRHPFWVFLGISVERRAHSKEKEKMTWEESKEKKKSKKSSIIKLEKKTTQWTTPEPSCHWLIFRLIPKEWSHGNIFSLQTHVSVSFVIFLCTGQYSRISWTVDCWEFKHLLQEQDGGERSYWYSSPRKKLQSEPILLQTANLKDVSL